MSFNDVHKLKPENLTLRTVYGFDNLGNRVPVDYYITGSQRMNL